MEEKVIIDGVEYNRDEVEIYTVSQILNVIDKSWDIIKPRLNLLTLESVISEFRYLFCAPTHGLLIIDDDDESKVFCDSL